MITAQSCSRCGTFNTIGAAGVTVCRRCGHQLGVPRLACDCAACRRTPR